MLQQKGNDCARETQIAAASEQVHRSRFVEVYIGSRFVEVYIEVVLGCVPEAD